MHRLRIALIALLLVAVTTPARAQGSTEAAFKKDSLAVARQLTSWLYAGQADSLFARHSVDAKATLRNSATLNEPIAELASRAGQEVEVLAERFVRRKGRTQYWRTAKFSDYPEPLLVRIAFNRQGQVVGIGLAPESQAPLVDVR
jgi:leucyl aminopeptidase